MKKTKDHLIQELLDQNKVIPDDLPRRETDLYKTLYSALSEGTINSDPDKKYQIAKGIKSESFPFWDYVLVILAIMLLVSIGIVANLIF